MGSLNLKCIFISQPYVKYGVRSAKFIWAPGYNGIHWLRALQLPLPGPHLGSYYEGAIGQPR